jgi:hypothetical protein
MKPIGKLGHLFNLVVLQPISNENSVYFYQHDPWFAIMKKKKRGKKEINNT